MLPLPCRHTVAAAHAAATRHALLRHAADTDTPLYATLIRAICCHYAIARFHADTFTPLLLLERLKRRRYAFKMLPRSAMLAFLRYAHARYDTP